jgi:hypothetical protein
VSQDKYKDRIDDYKTKQYTLLAHNKELETELDRVVSHEKNDANIREAREETLRLETDRALMALSDIESRALNVVPTKDKATDTADMPMSVSHGQEISSGSTTPSPKKKLKVRTDLSPSPSTMSPAASSRSRRRHNSDDKDNASVATVGSVPTRMGSKKTIRTTKSINSRKQPRSGQASPDSLIGADMTDNIDSKPSSPKRSSPKMSSRHAQNSPQEYFDFKAIDDSKDISEDQRVADSVDDRKHTSHSSEQEDREETTDSHEISWDGDESPAAGCGGGEVEEGEGDCCEDMQDLEQDDQEQEDEQEQEQEVEVEVGGGELEQETEWNDGWFNMGAPSPKQKKPSYVPSTPPTKKAEVARSALVDDDRSLDLDLASIPSQQPSRCTSEENNHKNIDTLPNPSVSAFDVSQEECAPERRLSAATAPMGQVSGRASEIMPSARAILDREIVPKTPLTTNTAQGIVFDSSLAQKSSSNYFFDILERRERRNLFENSRLRIIAREAAALVDRLESKLLALSAESLNQPKNIVSRGSRAVDSMREDIADNKWIFSLKAEHIIQDAVLKDTILIAGNMRSVEALEEDLVSLQHCKQAFGNDHKLSGAVATMKRAVMDHRDEALRRGHQESKATGRSGWQAVLYRNDGTIDTNMSLFGWDKSEKIEIYKEIVSALRLEIDDKTKAYGREISRMKDTISSLIEESREKSHGIDALNQRLDMVERNSVGVSEFEEMARAVQDVTALLRNLTAASMQADGEVPHRRTSSFDGGQSMATGAGTVAPLKDGVGAPTSSSLYGNPALLWHKLAAEQKTRPQSTKRRSSAPEKSQARASSSSYGVLEGGPSVTGSSVADVFHENHAYRDHMLQLQLAADGSSIMNDSILDSTVAGAVNEDGAVDAFDSVYQDTNQHSSVHCDVVLPLLRELNVACESITERVLLPSALRIAKPLVSDQGASSVGYGEDNFRSQVTAEGGAGQGSGGGSTVSPLVLSKDILHYSETVNKEINTHIRAIKQLEQKQRTLFDHNLRSLSKEAERYYADSVKIGESTHNLCNWANVFAQGQGSASPVVLGLLRRCDQQEVEALTSRGGVESTPQMDELPVIEKRALGNMTVKQPRPASAQSLLHSASAPCGIGEHEGSDMEGDDGIEPLRSFQFLPDFRNAALLRQQPKMVKRKSKKYYRR